MNSKRIFKYPFDISDAFELKMPKNANILTLQTQRGVPCIWAMIEPAQKLEVRRFYMRGTGQPFTGDEGLYIGSFKMENERLIFHVFEEARE